MVPKVSVIVPVYNGEKTLSLCLDSLMSLDYPKEQLEIIVVENNSTDASPNIIKKYPVKYIFEKKKGTAIAKNIGIKVSAGELIAFTDQDCIVDKAWIKNMVESFKNDFKIGACGGKTLSYKPRTWLEKCNDFIPSIVTIFSKNNFLPFIQSCNVMYRKDVLYEIGLHDERIGFCSDLDISWRICLKGYHLKFVPEAVVYHKRRDKLNAFFAQYFKYGYEDYNVWLKYKGLVNKDSINFNLRPSSEQFLEILRSIMFFIVNFFKLKDNLDKNLYLFKFIRDVAYNVGWFFRSITSKIRRHKIPSPISVKDKVIWWNHDNGGIIVFIKNGCYNRNNLNGVAWQIWTLLMAGKKDSEIVDIVTNEYNVDKEKANKDVVNFIEELKKESLLFNL